MDAAADFDLFEVVMTILRNQVAILDAVAPRPGVANLELGQVERERIRETQALIDRLLKTKST